MLRHDKASGRKRRALLFAAVFAAAPAAAWAQPVQPVSAQPSDSSMVNLVRLLVEQGVITKDKGDALMAQALTEAAQARAAQASASATAGQQVAQLPPPAAGAIRVPYVPETVRAQIKDELKAEVMAQAKAEGWAAPGEGAPDWVERVRLFGDIRIRAQSNLYSDSNSNLIPDFARVNEIGPIPIFERDTFLPLLNTREDRANRLLVRARLGVEATLSERLKAGILLATGDNDSPISTNQLLGGGFGKRDIWLQHAYIKARPTPWSEVSLGRFDNPFVSTELLFDEDLAFDGVSARLSSEELFDGDFNVALRGGAFPLDFGDPNFPQNDVDKRNYPERWLFSGQIELGASFGDKASGRLAVAYHSFTNVQANLSEPCFLYRIPSSARSEAQCSTDNERATFLRKGNTVFPIRDVVLDVPPPAANEVRVSPQYVGLALDYDILNVNAEVNFPIGADMAVTLTGDYVKNLGFDRDDLCRFGPAFSAAYPPLNNVGADGDGNICSATNPSSFVGGDEGYLGRLRVGHGALRKFGEWQAEIGYRYLESDAVLDAFTDSDFHFGGTNAKGYFIGAKTYLFDGTTLGARWLSANEISAEPLSIDVLQVDLQVAF